MSVKVRTDPDAKSASVSIAADDQALGWTVETTVLQLTFGSTLFLGMDERASRQGFTWKGTANSATIVVPRPLSSISVTGGAKVEADMVAWDLSASEQSSLLVGEVQPFPSNRSRLFRVETGGVIVVDRGAVQHAMIQAFGKDTLVNLSGAEIGVANVEADDGSRVAVNVTKEVQVSCESDASEKTRVEIIGGATLTDLSETGCNISHVDAAVMQTWHPNNSVTIAPAAFEAAASFMVPEVTCAGLEGVNAACKDDVEWAFSTGKYTAPLSYSTLETLEGVDRLAATIDDYQKGFYCGIIGKKEQRCALPPCSCTRPPCNVCQAEKPSETVKETGIMFP